MTKTVYFTVALMAFHACFDLANCRDSSIGSTQDSVMQLDDCLRSAVPTQVYITCCIRENNCSLSRYQMKAMECISRITVMNSTLLMSSQTNSYSSSMSSSSERWPDGEMLRRAAEICRAQYSSRQQLIQNCIRNELSRYCQNQMTTYKPGSGYRMYSRRGPIPASAWDSSIYSDSYPVDSVEWRRRGIIYPDMSYYPKTFASRRLYGRESGSSRTNGGDSSYSYGGGDSSPSSYYEEDYGSQMDESYSK